MSRMSGMNQNPYVQGAYTAKKHPASRSATYLKEMNISLPSQRPLGTAPS